MSAKPSGRKRGGGGGAGVGGNGGTPAVLDTVVSAWTPRTVLLSIASIMLIIYSTLYGNGWDGADQPEETRLFSFQATEGAREAEAEPLLRSSRNKHKRRRRRGETVEQGVAAATAPVSNLVSAPLMLPAATHAAAAAAAAAVSATASPLLDLDYDRTYTALIAGTWFGTHHPWATGRMTCATGCKLHFSHHGIDAETADAVLLHGAHPDMAMNRGVLDRPPRAGQVRLLFAAENFPPFTEEAALLAGFEGEVSYRMRSLARDIQYPLETITRWQRGAAAVTMSSTWADVTNPETRLVPAAARRGAAEGTISWASNHCESRSGREDYARELNKHIPVEIYAAPCLKNAPLEHVKLTKDGQWNLWRNYKFYLAFENTRCVDYFTEKLFLAFTRGQVPIVLGGANAAQHMPSAHSFIDVRDYASPRALAEYLWYLDGNATAYEAYFAWHALPFEQYGAGFREAIRAALPTAVMNGGWGKNANFFGCSLCEGLARWHALGRTSAPVPPFQCEGPVKIAEDGSAEF